ncbi:FCD domain-containing protein [Actinoplanes missouriensis]|uniref:FadR/GntR family transcriptional regulator n=1 Tax=Actinoplanes missouriensis TaxID=1866 RepID=UPI0033D42324
MEQVRREPLADQAARLLLERIRSGEWSLGEKLPGETTLGPQLGVGRSTVREAIRQLAGQGVLATRQGAGVFLTALDVTEDWDAVLRRADIVAVIEARIAIEVEAAALAAERRTPGDLAAIRAALDERAARRSTAEEHVDADMAFHRAVVAASGNALLVELFDGFVPRSRASMVDMLRLKGEFGGADDHDVHARVLAAVADGDVKAAADLSRAHLLSIKRWVVHR